MLVSTDFLTGSLMESNFTLDSRSTSQLCTKALKRPPHIKKLLSVTSGKAAVDTVQFTKDQLNGTGENGGSFGFY